MEAQARDCEAKIAQSTGKEALNHAIAAAELYMKAVREAPNAAEKARLKRKCEELLTRAEHLKSPPVQVPVRPKWPRQTRQLPTGEKAILLRSSRLHGALFPPWEAEPDSTAFKKSSPKEPLYTDPSTFPLSQRQSDIFGGWKRPGQLFHVSESTAGGEIPDSMMIARTESDLVQDITTDCSVVASLCAAMPHFLRKKNSMLSTLMYPFDADAFRPLISENGKYIFRLHFNGCFRQVVIDDRLPASKTSRTLFVVDRKNPHLIWPALLEKAYLKVRGGYDFPGSNSGTDLWVLTGWIPEQVFLQSDDIEVDQTWKRIKNSYDYGDVVITLGTGRLSPEEEDTLGLAGEHDYAVLDMKVDDGSGARRMLLKNPWCDGLVWKGVGSSATIDVAGYPPSSSSRNNPTTDQTGAFWITFEDVIQNFESLYLNWNPGLFTDRQDHHLTWTIPSPSMVLSFAHNPQYSFSSSTSGAVWILLSRHFQDGELSIARNRTATNNVGGPQDGGLAAVSNSLGFMSLYLFNTTKGQRVQLPDRALHRGAYVDSPQTLMRVDAEAGVKYTVAVAQQDLPLPKYSFTLSFFSRSPLDVNPAAPAHQHYEELEGSWTRRTAGGNAATATFLHNPQFSIAVPHPTPISLLLCADTADVPVHVDLVWAGGERVTALTTRDIIASSGEYRRGCALAETKGPTTLVEAGTYTAVVSTFEPGQHARFTLRVGSNVPLTIKPVLSDAAGRLRTELAPIAFHDAVQGAGDTDTVQRARLAVSRLTRASLVARSGSLSGIGGSIPAAAPSSLRVSFECGSGPHRRTLAISGDGDFTDGTMGVRTPESDLDPDVIRAAGGLWIVVEQMGGRTADQGVQVDVLSDGQVSVGAWETVERY